MAMSSVMGSARRNENGWRKRIAKNVGEALGEEKERKRKQKGTKGEERSKKGKKLERWTSS
jgi:hypothetical protein